MSSIHVEDVPGRAPDINQEKSSRGAIPNCCPTVDRRALHRSVTDALISIPCLQHQLSFTENAHGLHVDIANAERALIILYVLLGAEGYRTPEPLRWWNVRGSLHEWTLFLGKIEPNLRQDAHHQ